MRLLNDEEEKQLTADLYEALPRIVLHIISWAPGHVGQVTRLAQKWYSGSESLRDTVGTIVAGFEQRGDIERGKGGILRCLPPYVVGEAFGTKVALYGNPAVEPALVSSAVSGSVRYEMHGDDPVRYLVVPGVAPTTELFLSCGVQVFSPSSLVERIPRIVDLRWPNSREFHSIPFTGGVWEAYDPEAMPKGYQEGRWVPVVSWKRVISKLVRWTPEGEKHDLQRQFYLHNGLGQISEVGWEQARLWQFGIDQQKRMPVEWRYDETARCLSVNAILPVSASRTLRILSGAPVRREGFETLYVIQPDVLPQAAAVATRLGTTIVRKRLA